MYFQQGTPKSTVGWTSFQVDTQEIQSHETHAELSWQKLTPELFTNAESSKRVHVQAENSVSLAARGENSWVSVELLGEPWHSLH